MLRRTFATTVLSLFMGSTLDSRPEPTRLFPFALGIVIGGKKYPVHPDSFTIDFIRMKVCITIAYTVKVKGTLSHAYLDKLDKIELHECNLAPGDTLHCSLMFDLKTKKFSNAFTARTR